jgi:hypothetical protein
MQTPTFAACDSLYVRDAKSAFAPYVPEVVVVRFSLCEVVHFNRINAYWIGQEAVKIATRQAE